MKEVILSLGGGLQTTMKKVLSFGGGLQTTALAIMVATGELEVDEVVFADTRAEKPETYWYIDNFIKPMLEEIKMPYIVALPTKHYGDSLYDYLWRYRQIPHIKTRECTAKFKRLPIERVTGKEAEILIGFSSDEYTRSQKPIHQIGFKTFPLIERGLTGNDCRQIISDYGFPIPLKSSCFFCPFQRWSEWNWLKSNNPGLLDKAVKLEANLYDRKPQLRHTIGLFGGKPLWKFQEGIQYEFGFPEEYSCWSGQCGH